jgi:hypothetical protein
MAFIVHPQISRSRDAIASVLYRQAKPPPARRARHIAQEEAYAASRHL